MDTAPRLRRRWISHGLVLAGCLLAVFAWPRLPDRIPIHWNLAGEPNGYGGKAVGVLLFPALLVVIHGLFALLPRISPRDWPIAPFAAAYETMRIAILGFLLYVMALALAAGAGLDVGMTGGILAGMGALFMALGTQLGAVTPNYFVGIRTPWTLTDREVWRRTHALAGRTFMAGGAVMVLASLVSNRWIALGLGVIALIVSAATPVYYSWVYSRDRERMNSIT